jgi:hypothetical protein
MKKEVKKHIKDMKQVKTVVNQMIERVLQQRETARGR